jgi:hypothetical protein
MKQLYTEGIVNALFFVSGLDLDTHYKRFFKEGNEAIAILEEQFKKRLLNDFDSILNNSFWMMEMYLENIPREIRGNMTFEQQKEYCKGFNDSVYEHNERVKIIKAIVLSDLNKLLNQ